MKREETINIISQLIAALDIQRRGLSLQQHGEDLDTCAYDEEADECFDEVARIVFDARSFINRLSEC